MNDDRPDPNCIAIAAATLARTTFTPRPTPERMRSSVADALEIHRQASALIADPHADPVAARASLERKAAASEGALPRIDNITLERGPDGKPVALVRDGGWQPLGGTFEVSPEARDRNRCGVLEDLPRCRGTVVAQFDEPRTIVLPANPEPGTVVEVINPGDRPLRIETSPREPLRDDEGLAAVLTRSSQSPTFLAERLLDGTRLDAAQAAYIHGLVDGCDTSDAPREWVHSDHLVDARMLLEAAVADRDTAREQRDEARSMATRYQRERNEAREDLMRAQASGSQEIASVMEQLDRERVDGAQAMRNLEELERVTDDRDGLRRLLDDALIERDLMVAGVRKLRHAWNVAGQEVGEGHDAKAIDDTLHRLSGILERIPGEPSPVAERHAVIENAATGELMRIAPGAELPRGSWLMAAPIGDRTNMAERMLDRLVDYLRQVRDLFDDTYRDHDPDVFAPVLVPLRGIVNASADLIDGPDPVARILGGLYVTDPKALKPDPPVDVAQVTADLSRHVAEAMVAGIPSAGVPGLGDLDRPHLVRLIERLGHSRTKWPAGAGGFEPEQRRGILAAEVLEVVAAERTLDEVLAEGGHVDGTYERQAAAHDHLGEELLDVAAVALRWAIAHGGFDA